MTEVNLHVYDVTNTAYDQANHFIMRMNNLTRDISVGGLFHGAVEVYGREWSFGFCEEGSGVYACIPKLNRQYTYRETVPLGELNTASERSTGFCGKCGTSGRATATTCSHATVATFVKNSANALGLNRSQDG
eukprot:CAMPEP_0177586064 /NCGR_PEP_ID=MMETSP0419_2-20121207/4861_1 /TAXON_ID=582737 /ORGANISM="Tetraselmis sp., Strain GSL018" /LENGTH=132 /DNA_ID=CAMNT_0019075907 /DNA_START=92 /DNA_END=491 /DNA_ORIENTATION=-